MIIQGSLKIFWVYEIQNYRKVKEKKYIFLKCILRRFYEIFYVNNNYVLIYMLMLYQLFNDLYRF